jgi:hypothetical protein
MATLSRALALALLLRSNEVPTRLQIILVKEILREKEAELSILADKISELQSLQTLIEKNKPISLQAWTVIGAFLLQSAAFHRKLSERFSSISCLPCISAWKAWIVLP